MIINYLEKVKENTKSIVMDYINLEIGYVHTSDQIFQKSYLDSQLINEQEKGKKDLDK